MKKILAAIAIGAAAALAACTCVTVLSWRQTPDQHRYLTTASYNAAVASWYAAQTAAHVSEATAPLADPKTGLSASMAQLVRVISDTSETAGGTLTNVAALADTLNTRAGDLGGAIVEIKSALIPGLNSANGLIQNYSALPAQLGARLDPAWAALEPEFTCRKADGSSYSGCWHSDFTGLLGEAKRAGGVFTQKFPEFVGTFQQTNVHLSVLSGSFADMFGKIDQRYFSPRTTKQKIWSGVKDTIGLGSVLAERSIF